MQNQQEKKKKLGKQRRGVGAIVGGVLLTAILLTTLLLYFITILDNDQRRASYDIQSAQVNQDKSAERLSASRDKDFFTNATGSYLNTIMANDGSLPLVVSYSVLHCIDCASPNNPNIKPVNIALNSQEPTSRHIGPISDGFSYRVDLITERGNIVSTEECIVDLGAGICTNDVDVGTPDFTLSADPSTIVMEAGNSALSIISVTSFNGYISPVTLSASSPAAGIGSSFTINPVTPPSGSSASSTLTITTDTTTSPGTYNMIITGTDGSITHTASIGLTILDDNSGAITEGIIQGTGSMQLDFRAFGVIYPQLGTRDGIDQTGWNGRVSSNYSSVHGYPGFQLMTITAGSGGGNPVSTTFMTIVESARNLDPAGEDLTLTRFSGMNPALGAIQGSNSKLAFICKEDTNAKTVTAYDEDTANKILQNVALDAPLTVGWTEMYFCVTNPGTTPSMSGGNPTWFNPSDLKFANLTPLFLVARGDFESGAPYSQTIPYQAFTVGKGPGTVIINACLLSSNTLTDCPAHGTNQASDASFRYDATESQLQSGVTVWLHLNSGPTFTDGIDVRWMHPDGTYETLLENQPTSVINANGNIPVDLPTDMAGASPGTDEFHTLVFNDGRDSSGDRYIYYMTFQVEC